MKLLEMTFAPVGDQFQVWIPILPAIERALLALVLPALIKVPVVKDHDGSLHQEVGHKIQYYRRRFVQIAVDMDDSSP